VPPSGVITTLNISFVSGSESTSGNGGTTGGGGVRASTSTQVPLTTFNPVVEFFCELQHNYHKVMTTITIHGFSN
jgi:hypothetical protein